MLIFRGITDKNNGNIAVLCNYLRKHFLGVWNERICMEYYNGTWDSYILKYVLDEDRDALKKAVSPDTVRRMLENRDEYGYSYRIVCDGVGVHHYQAVFMRMYTGKALESHIILGFRNADAIVEEERKYTKIQEEQLRIIDALSQEYHSLFKIDVKKDTISLYRTDGVGMDPGRLQADGSRQLQGDPFQIH